MKDLTLYEKIPESSFPIRLLDYVGALYNFPLHWHEHTEIHFIFQGNAQVRCGDELIKLKENDCVIINGNELHQGMDGVCDYGCMILPPSFFEDAHVIFNRTVSDENISDFFHAIYRSLRSQTIGYKQEIKGHVYLLLAYLTQNYAKEILSETGYFHHVQKLDKINGAVQYINENFTEKITTEQLADIAHLSEGYFCNMFKEVTGMTAKEYINDLRIKKAAALISAGGMNVTEAAMYSGFSDANYFSRVFKKRLGFTPNSVRKKADILRVCTEKPKALKALAK